MLIGLIGLVVALVVSFLFEWGVCGMNSREAVKENLKKSKMVLLPFLSVVPFYFLGSFIQPEQVEGLTGMETLVSSSWKFMLGACGLMLWIAILCAFFRKPVVETKSNGQITIRQKRFFEGRK